MRTIRTSCDWDVKTLISRIADPKKKHRFEAGSPNPLEVACYRRLLKSFLHRQKKPRVIVLGMTPELRSMALSEGAQVVSIDNNPFAIDLYRDWLPKVFQDRETIIKANWQEVGECIDGPVNAILGDGVFGNILTIQGHAKLLAVLSNILKPGGGIVLRKILIPEGFPREDYEASVLVKKFRAGLLSEAEFGFGMRIWGSFEQAYSWETLQLDNSIVFECYRRWVCQGRLTKNELDIIYRYYYGGLNMILPQNKWEALLDQAGFGFEQHILQGKSWYVYYPFYRCSPRDHRKRLRDT